MGEQQRTAAAHVACRTEPDAVAFDFRERAFELVPPNSVRSVRKPLDSRRSG